MTTELPSLGDTDLVCWVACSRVAPRSHCSDQECTWSPSGGQRYGGHHSLGTQAAGSI